MISNDATPQKGASRFSEIYLMAVLYFANIVMIFENTSEVLSMLSYSHKHFSLLE
jgi:hypothetical protein